MFTNNWLVLDVATAGLANVTDYIEPPDSPKRKPPSNYTKPDSIAEWRRKDYESDIAAAGLDMDLARITGIGMLIPGGELSIGVCPDEHAERDALLALAEYVRATDTIVTYGGLSFDLPLLMRRARYLDVSFPWLNLDRYRSNHCDLCDVLSDRNPQRRRSLLFYTKRLGWTDITKPLSGADESRVFETGNWEGLRQSIEHDVTATYRLAQWLKVIAVPQPEPAGFVEVGL